MKFWKRSLELALVVSERIIVDDNTTMSTQNQQQDTKRTRQQNTHQLLHCVITILTAATPTLTL